MILAILLMTTSAAADTTAEQLDLAQRTGRYLCEWRVAAGLTGEKVPELKICAQMPDDRLEIMWAINGWWQHWYKVDVPVAEAMRKRFDEDFAKATPIKDVVGLFRADIAAAQALERRKREAELAAIASPAHPFAGFWKVENCDDEFGLAVSPAGRPGFYSVSFCGPGGCFKPGTYRPNTTITGDRAYRVLDKDAIDVRGSDGFSRYVRCPGREADNAAMPDVAEDSRTSP